MRSAQLLVLLLAVACSTQEKARGGVADPTGHPRLGGREPGAPPAPLAAGGGRRDRRHRAAGHAGEGAARPLALLRPAPLGRRHGLLRLLPRAVGGLQRADSPVSTGVGGKKGTRKAPPVLNAAFPIYPVWFWDGRAHVARRAGQGADGEPGRDGDDPRRDRVGHPGHPGLPALLRRGLRRRAHRRGPRRRGHRRLRGHAPLRQLRLRPLGRRRPGALDEKQKQGFRLFFGKARLQPVPPRPQPHRLPLPQPGRRLAPAAPGPTPPRASPTRAAPR